MDAAHSSFPLVEFLELENTELVGEGTIVFDQFHVDIVAAPICLLEVVQSFFVPVLVLSFCWTQLGCL